MGWYGSIEYNEGDEKLRRERDYYIIFVLDICRTYEPFHAELNLPQICQRVLMDRDTLGLRQHLKFFTADE